MNWYWYELTKLAVGLIQQWHAPRWSRPLLSRVRTYQHRKNVRLGFLFLRFSFIDRQSAAKAAKTGSL